MKNVLSNLVPVSVLALASAAAQASTIYPGNGGTSFGGVLSGGSITIDNTPTGQLNFTYAHPLANFSRNLVLYIDSVAGGFDNNFLMTGANTTDNQRAAQGYNSSNSALAAITLPSGFSADYVVGLTVRTTPDGTLWTLAQSGSVVNLTSPTGITAAGTQTTNATFSFNLSSIGLTNTPGTSFKFLATYLNGSNVTRSNEFIGAYTANVAPDANGNISDVTMNDYRTFTVPEPATALLLAPLAVLRRRRRRAAR